MWLRLSEEWDIQENELDKDVEFMIAWNKVNTGVIPIERIIVGFSNIFTRIGFFNLTLGFLKKLQ